LAGLSQARFLVNCHEALGLTFEQALESSMSLIESMLQEYIYIQREKNKALHKNDNIDENGRKFEWVELPSFDNPGEMIKYKKYEDIGDAFKA